MDSYLHELHGDELESLLLEPLDDVAAEAALHAVGLDHDEGALVNRRLLVGLGCNSMNILVKHLTPTLIMFEVLRYVQSSCH